MVVRYFGGTLLGVSGLINAYRSAAADALANAEIIEKQVQDVYEASFDYPAMNEVMKIIKDESLEIASQNFELKCSVIFSVRKNKCEQVAGMMKKISGLQLNYIRTI